MLNNEELKHYGIKGQKWGRRRFQNADGSLTPEGVKRYGSSEDALRATKKLVDGGKDISRVTKEYDAERSRKKQKKADKALEVAVRDKARNMSDQELREAVNRLNMEENYTRMMQNRERIDVGESAVTKLLDGTMKGLTLTSTALAIALTIKELRS